jgi:multicomponent Na+:H+ antiporter subunit F
MSVDTIFDYAVTLALAILCLAFFVTIYRIIKGPTLPDRILGLDMLVAIAIGFIAVIGIKTGFTRSTSMWPSRWVWSVSWQPWRLPGFVLSRGKTEDDILTEARIAAQEVRREAKSAAKAAARAGVNADGANAAGSADETRGERR